MKKSTEVDARSAKAVTKVSDLRVKLSRFCLASRELYVRLIGDIESYGSIH